MSNERQGVLQLHHALPTSGRVPLWSVEHVDEGAVRQWIRDGVFPIGMSVSDVIKRGTGSVTWNYLKDSDIMRHGTSESNHAADMATVNGHDRRC